jgi:hypothetical protein
MLYVYGITQGIYTNSVPQIQPSTSQHYTDQGPDNQRVDTEQKPEDKSNTASRQAASLDQQQSSARRQGEHEAETLIPASLSKLEKSFELVSLLSATFSRIYASPSPL